MLKEYPSLRINCNADYPVLGDTLQKSTNGLQLSFDTMMLIKVNKFDQVREAIPVIYNTHS